MQTTTIPFTLGEESHSIRTEIKGLRHNIYLDDRLHYCHKAVPANGCSVYKMMLGDTKLEVFILQQTGEELTVAAYLDDRSVQPEDELPLSLRLEFLVTASDIDFKEHCKRAWPQAALRWGLWWIACVILFSIIGGGHAILWGATAGVGLIFAVIACFLDLNSTYRLVKRLKTPEDCYQHPAPVSSILP